MVQAEAAWIFITGSLESSVLLFVPAFIQFFLIQLFILNKFAVLNECLKLGLGWLSRGPGGQGKRYDVKLSIRDQYKLFSPISAIKKSRRKLIKQGS